MDHLDQLIVIAEYLVDDHVDVFISSVPDVIAAELNDHEIDGPALIELFGMSSLPFSLYGCGIS
jgi:hypothetical protein